MNVNLCSAVLFLPKKNRLLYVNTMVGLRKDIGKFELDVHKEGIYCRRVPLNLRGTMSPKVDSLRNPSNMFKSATRLVRFFGSIAGRIEAHSPGGGVNPTLRALRL